MVFQLFMIKKTEIEEIIVRCKDEDRKAQKLVYESYYARYFTLCLRYLGNSDLAAEAVNQLFLKVFTNIKTLKETKLFEGWMKRICINVCITEIRRNKDNLFESITDDSHFEGLTENNQAISNLTTEELLILITKLPTQMRNVFNMYVIDGFKHDEIAKILNISTGTSKYHLHQAKAKLKEKVEMNMEVKTENKMRSYG